MGPGVAGASFFPNLDARAHFFPVAHVVLVVDAGSGGGVGA